MSWAIGERLDPQSVKGELLNFHQVQTIDRESERFEEVGEPDEVFVVMIGTTATHDDHGVAGTDDTDAREIRQAARITLCRRAPAGRGGSIVSVIESLLVSTLSLDQHRQSCLCLELAEFYNQTRVMAVSFFQCLPVLPTVPAFDERRIPED